MLKLATMFVPFAGLIQAVKTIWETIQYIRKKIMEFMELLERILDALGPAANGDADAVAQGVEASFGEGTDASSRLVGKNSWLEWYR